MGETDYLIWWTTQSDCERIPTGGLDTWPTYLAGEFRSRYGRAGRGRLWFAPEVEAGPDGVTIDWDTTNNWLCAAANDAAGIVIRATDVHHIQFMPGFVTTFAMALPER